MSLRAFRSVAFGILLAAATALALTVFVSGWILSIFVGGPALGPVLAGVDVESLYFRIPMMVVYIAVMLAIAMLVPFWTVRVAERRWEFSRNIALFVAAVSLGIFGTWYVPAAYYVNRCVTNIPYQRGGCFGH